MIRPPHGVVCALSASSARSRHVARRYISEAHRRKPRTESPHTGSPQIDGSHSESSHPESAEPARELIALAEEYDERFPPTAICHNDLVAENILDTGELRLIDFEYAVRAAPVLDLASLAAMTRMTARQRRLLVEAYYPDGSASFSADEFARVVRLSKLIAFFWARSQDETVQARVSGHADLVKLLTEWP